MNKRNMKIKMSEGFQIEGCDRTHTLLVMLEELLGVPDDPSHQHPSIWNKECNKHLKKATQHLAALYQKIGEWEEFSGSLTRKDLCEGFSLDNPHKRSKN